MRISSNIPGFGILDRYVFFEFFKSFIGALALLLGIGIISKIMERLSILMSYDGPFFEILRYLFLNVPYTVTIIAPTALMFSISFTIANFSRKKELAVIMTSGRSFRRILTPVIVFTFFYSIFSFFLTEYVSYPWYLRSFDHLYDVLMHHNDYRSTTRSNYHTKINNRFLYIDRYDEKYNIIYHLNVVEFSHNSPSSIINSRFAIIVPKMWILLDGDKIMLNPDHSFKKRTYFKMTTLNIKENYEFLKNHWSSFEEKSVFQLQKEMDLRKKHGEDYRKYLVEYYWHYSIPFVSLFIVMIAGIMGSGVKKGAVSLSIGISTFITLLYYLLMYTGKSLAVNGTFHPLFGAWFANLIFALLSVYMYNRYKI